MRPMLAQPAAESFRAAIMRAVNNDDVGLDLKMDGERLLVVVTNGIVEGFNRDGAPTHLPRAVKAAIQPHFTNITFDGEVVNGTYHIFDLLGSGVMPSDRWDVRRHTLERLVRVWEPDPQAIQTVPYAIGKEAKALLATQVLEQDLEGVIAKRLDSPYRSPRKDNERSEFWTKLKFTKDADFVVTRLGIDGKQNYAIGVYDPGATVPREVGEVSALTGDGPRVGVGDVVTVTYLYVGANGRLVQPVKGRLRTDKRPEECSADQLEPPKARRTRERMK